MLARLGSKLAAHPQMGDNGVTRADGPSPLAHATPRC
jgi:hypothetical protein